MQNFEYQISQENRKRNRVFARSLFPMDREVRFRSEKMKADQKGVLHSISQSGLFVRSPKIPEMGSAILINFLFGSQRIQCEGKVIYNNSGSDGLSTQGFGVKFTRMLTKDYEQIREAVESFHQTMRV